MLKGIDISKWQGQPDFEKVKADGWQFVIIKAVEGIGFTDPQFKRNQSECRRLGIPLGYYAFVRPDLGNSPEDEAEYFLKVIGELKPGELLFLDFERTGTVDWCKRWLDFVHLRTGVKAPIYLNKSLESNNNWSSVINANYGLWLADYTYKQNSPPPPVQWPVMAFRQYSNAEKVDGISGNVDGNVFYGDLGTLKQYGYKEAPEQPDDCEEIKKDLKDAKHKLESKATEITSLEGKLKTCFGNLETVTTNYDAALGLIRSKNTIIEEKNTDIVRLQNQKFYLHEIFNLLLVWIRTGGDSKDA